MAARLLYTVREAAEILGLSRTKIYELLNEGRLGGVHIDGSRRIPGQALEAFVAQLYGGGGTAAGRGHEA